jgi:hypothetical protein
MRTTRLVAEASADPNDWMEWLTTLALALGLPDPLPETPASGGPGGPIPADPNAIARSTIIPLASFPGPLRPPGVPVERRSVALFMVIRRALYSTQTGVDGEGRPVSTTEDRGWECDVVTTVGSGLPWDVTLLPDIITMSVQANQETVPWATRTRGLLELPATDGGWAIVNTETPTVVWAEYEPPAVVSGPIDPPTPPGAP